MDSSIKAFFEQRLAGLRTGFRHNPAQVGYAESVSRAINAGPGHISFIQGDTGIGKTLGYLVPAALWQAQTPRQERHTRPRRIIISTHSRALQRQLADHDTCHVVNEFRHMTGHPPIRLTIRMGRMNYVNPDRVAAVLGEAPNPQALPRILSDKHRSEAEKALAQWAWDNPRGCLLDYDSERLPSGVRPRDIALAPHDTLPDDLAVHFEPNRKADVLVINHALLASELTYHTSLLDDADRDTLLILDEAEHFPDVANQMLSKKLSFGQLSSLARRLNYPAHHRRWQQLFEQFKSAGTSNRIREIRTSERELIADSLLRLSQSSRCDPDLGPHQAAWNEVRELAPWLRRTIVSGDPGAVLSFSPAEGHPSLVYAAQSGGATLQNGMAERRTILTSATLADMRVNSWNQSFHNITRDLRLAHNDTRIAVTQVHEAQQFGQLSFHIQADAGPPLEPGIEGFKLRADYLSNAIQAICRPCHGRTLVLCGSYNDQHQLAEALPEAMLGRAVFPRQGVDLTTVANGLDRNAILVTPGGWEGLSPKRGNQPFWQRIVLLRNPYMPIDEVQLHVASRTLQERLGIRRAQAERQTRKTFHAAAHTRVLQRLRQGIGRGLRHPEDKCEIVILDPRMIGQSVTEKELRGLSGCIPGRFQATYKNTLAKLDSNTAPSVVL